MTGVRFLGLVLSLVVVFGFACTRSGSTSPDRTSVSDEEQSASLVVAMAGGLTRDAVIDAFVTQVIPGFLPFRTPAAYLDWLASRPGTASYLLDAQQLATGDWMVAVVLTDVGGQQVRAECRFDPTPGAASAGPFWQTCSQFGALWTAFAPTTFASLDDARPFLPPVSLALPTQAPGSFRVARVLLPATGPAAQSDLFVVRIVYVDDAGTEVVLAQQLPGTWTALFADWQRCRRGEWSPPGGCRYFVSKLSSVVLSSDTASSVTLDDFARALDARQPP